MKRGRRNFRAEVFLGIEAGGTRTVAAALDCLPKSGSTKLSLSIRREFGPANLRLLNDEQLIRHFQEIASAMPHPLTLAIGMAGTRTEADRKRILDAAARSWPGVPCLATNDLETALAAAEYNGRLNRPRRGVGWGATRGTAQAQVLVLSGTGSCCFGRTSDGRTAKIGGWGHLLGDKGSGYEIGLRSLKAVVYYYDRDAVWSRLGQKLLRVLQLNEPDELIGWVQSACKKEVAALAVEVFKAAKERDEIALDILAGAVASLACDAVACAQRLVRKNARIQFVFAGSVLLKQPSFAKQVAAELHKRWRHSAITHLKRESVYGAIELARQLAGRSQPCAHSEIISTSRRSFKLWTSDAPTEQRNPRSMKLDKLSVADAISLMLSEDQKISAALAKARKEIEQAVLLIVRAFREHGRLFYVGAGTSGRLGILDASECPPTFGSSPEMVQGIIAGGQRALWEAVEGAEDDFEAGSRAIKFRGVEGRDVVVGIAASGRTPFVWGALEEARRSRAKTVLLCFNPHLKLAHAPDVLIAPNVGPEVLTGSTRLKAGTATKQILNILTTLAMVRLGKVLENLMVDLKPTNSKLRDRAVRIVQDLTGTGPNSALAALESSAWEIKRAIKKIKE